VEDGRRRQRLDGHLAQSGNEKAREQRRIPAIQPYERMSGRDSPGGAPKREVALTAPGLDNDKRPNRPLLLHE
jgi:hypothetical protein